MVLKLRLKEARLLKGLSLREAAKGLEISYRDLQVAEMGKKTKIEFGSETLIKFARFYGVTIDYLMPNPDRPKIELTNIKFCKPTEDF